MASCENYFLCTLPVVRRPISANSRLNFLLLLLKRIFSDNYYISIFLKHSIIKLRAKRIKLNLLFNLSYLNSNFALSLEYLNPALNNPVLYAYMTWHAKEQAYSVLVKSSQWYIINAAFWLVALLLSYML